MSFHTAVLFETEHDPYCHFGIVSAPLAAALAGGLEGLGVAGGIASTAGTVGAGVLEGAALGAGSSAITGGNPLTGALTGGLTGGAVGGATAAGLGTLGTTAVGAGAGLIGAELTGGNPLTGALTGGGAGLLGASSGLGGGTGGTGSATVAPAATTSGAAGAASLAPTSITPPASAPVADPTAGGGSGIAAPAASTTAAPSLASASGGTAMPSDLTGGLLGTKDFGSSLVSHTTAPASGNVVDQITGGAGASGLGSFISKNPGVVLGAGALGANMLFGNKPTHAETQLNQQAGEAASQAGALASYQLTGTLPSGLQSVVDRSQQHAIAKIKNQYAALGMAGSTAEAQAVASAQQESAVQVADIADKLARQGIAWEQLSSTDLENVIRAQQMRDQSFTSALTTFAAGLAGAKINTGSTG